MLEALVLGNGHSHCDTHSVVGTEGGSLSLYPLAVNPGLDRVLEEVVFGVGGLLRNHIHMALEDYAAPVLVAWGGRYSDDYIAGLIGEGIDIALFGPVKNVLTHDFFVL